MGQLAREVAGLKTIFYAEHEHERGPTLQYEYYIASDSEGPAKDIYLEYGIILVTRRVVKYHLYEEGGIYQLHIDEQYTGRSGYIYPEPTKTEVASRNNHKAAIEYLIQKILEWPRNERARININALEAALRNALM